MMAADGGLRYQRRLPSLRPACGETLASAGALSPRRGIRWRGYPRARSQPGERLGWRRSSRCATTQKRHERCRSGDAGRNSPSSAVHRLHACPQDTLPSWLVNPRRYSHAGSAGRNVAHSLSPLMHVAIHKTSPVPCSPGPGRPRLAFPHRGVCSMRAVVPPE